jgi:hypothetical protein
MKREGLPTVRIRTLDDEGVVTGEVTLSPDAARTAAANLEVAVENLGMLIDATGGVHHGGAVRVGSEGGVLEIAWTESGRFG